MFDCFKTKSEQKILDHIERNKSCDFINHQKAKLDQKILGYLERQESCEFDSFMETVEERIALSLPMLIEVIESYGNNFDAHEVLSNGLDNITKFLRKQFLGEEKTFKFSQSYQLNNLDAWMIRVVGKPGAGPASGVIGPAIRKAKRYNERHQSIDANPSLIDTERYHIDEYENENNTIESDVTALPARQQFVIRLTFGLHEYPELNGDNIYKLAEKIMGDTKKPRNFSYPELKKIRSRANKHLEATSEKCLLTQGEVASLLDICDRQVRNLKTEALETLRMAA